jgi:hypothetical protein
MMVVCCTWKTIRTTLISPGWKKMLSTGDIWECDA